MLSGWIGQLVNAQFRKDQSGQLVFLPYGPRRAGYYVDSASDDQKIRPLLTVYLLASGMFQVVGLSSSYLLAQATIFPDHPTSKGGKMEVFLVVYFISTLIFWLVPTLLLWKVYRDLVPALCSSLHEVRPESMGKLDSIPNPFRRRALIVVAGCSVLLLGVILLLISRVHR